MITCCKPNNNNKKQPKHHSTHLVWEAKAGGVPACATGSPEYLLAQRITIKQVYARPVFVVTQNACKVTSAEMNAAHLLIVRPRGC